jgi:hypothetical protein
MTKPTRSKAQIAADFAPLTAAQHRQFVTLKVAMWDRLSKGQHLAPQPDEYTLELRDQFHDVMVLLTRKIDHVEDKFRHHENQVGTMVKLSEDERALLIDVLGSHPSDVAKSLHAQIVRTTQPAPAVVEPAPLEAREAAIHELVSSGIAVDDAVAQVDAKGRS